MREFQKPFIVICIGFIISTASCTSTPIVAPSGQTAATNGSLGPTETQPPAATETITETATITPTPTKVPDVELAQLQLIRSSFFISEIVNHLDVPVVFEDQQPAFRLDVYDPLLDQHFVGDEPVDRYNSSTMVPCVLYPGETAYFLGGRALADWEFISVTSEPQSLITTYQSLGVPRPDWKENGTHYEIRELTWRLDGNVLYFSFRHDPVKIEYGGAYYFYGAMGLYDKDNHLLGIGRGNQRESMETGIADDFWMSLDLQTLGNNNRKEWDYFGVDDIKVRLDHIKVILEVMTKIDSVCRKRVPTPPA